MRADRHLGFVAAAATLLAAAPLSAIFDRWTWLVQCAIAVGLTAAAALLARSLRAPLWGQALAMSGALLLALTWLFPAGNGLLAVLPTPGAFAHFADLAQASVQDMRTLGVPVSDTDPLLFITVLGVGAVAIIVDICTVGLRRPALSGLPMLAIYSVPVAIHTSSVPPAPFIIGTAGFLWLLVADNVERVRQFGRRFTGDGRGVDVWEPSPLAAAGRRLAVLGVLLAVLLPLGVPGMTSGPLSWIAGSGGNGAGRGPGSGPGQIDLFAALSGELNQPDVRELVQVTTNDPNPYYLRFGVADVLRQEGFGVGNPSGRPVTGDLPDPRDLFPPSGLTQKRYQAQVEITDDFNMPLLPVFVEPLELRDVDSAWRYDPNRQIVFANQTRSKGKKYSFGYIRSTYTPVLLNNAPPLSSSDPLVQLTEVPVKIPEVTQLVAELTEGKRTDYARVRAIYDYFSRDNGFSYSLRTEGGTSGQEIVDFLTNKVGYCQQYASAMAWLVRVAGIPARVAVGFSNGSNRQGDTYTLTSLNLHAWTEVYFSGIGWVPFDATPAANVPGSARSDWAPDTDAPDPVPTAPVPGSSSEVDPSAAPGAGPDRGLDEGIEGSTQGSAPAAPRWPWWTIAGVLLGLVLLASPALLRALLRRRRHPRPVSIRSAAAVGPASTAAVNVTVDNTEADRRDAHAAWDELIDTLLDYRLPVDPGRTPRSISEELAGGALAGAAADSVRLLGLAEERARYAHTPLAGERLADALRAVRRTLRGQADRRTRLAATALPPSVLRRWRSTSVEVMTGWVTTGGRLRDRLLRWSPRRLLAQRAAGN